MVASLTTSAIPMLDVTTIAWKIYIVEIILLNERGGAANFWLTRRNFLVLFNGNTKASL